MSEDLQRNYGEGVNKSLYEKTDLNGPRENVLLGTVGALIGALAGVALIFILARIGYVASVCGLLMAYCSLFLYAKFAGKMSKKGIVISVVIMILAVILAEVLVYSSLIYDQMKEYGFSFGFVFTNIHTFIGLYEIENSFMKDLLMLYGFTALGAVPKIIDYAKKKPEEVSKEVEQTFEFGNTVQNSTETIDSNLMNGENSAKKFDEGFFN